jgi:hypothetical protein
MAHVGYFDTPNLYELEKNAGRKTFAVKSPRPIQNYFVP